MTSNHVLSGYVVETDSFRRAGSGPYVVLFSTRTGEWVLVSADLRDRLRRGETDAAPEWVLRSLLDKKILVPAGAYELESVLAENRCEIARDATLVRVIQPTAACQLGCGYCGQSHSNAMMSEECQDALVASVRAQIQDGVVTGSPYARLDVAWFGAEPLLGLRVMRQLSPRLIGLAEDHDLDYSARIVSNGMRLTHAIARELQVAHRVDGIDLTLDGPASHHDRRRHTKSGRATYQRIVENLLAVCGDPELRFRVSVRCNVDRHNADAVPDLIRELHDLGVAERIGLSFSPVYSWGNDADEQSLDPEDFARREIEWLATMMSMGFPVNLVPSRRRIVCLAVRRHGTVTDAFGQEFTCTEVPYVPAYGTPNRYLIPLQSSEPPAFRDFNERICAGRTPCAGCPQLPVCGGACPLAWSQGRVPCPSHRQNMADRVLLAYARHELAGAPSRT